MLRETAVRVQSQLRSSDTWRVSAVMSSWAILHDVNDPVHVELVLKNIKGNWPGRC